MNGSICFVSLPSAGRILAVSERRQQLELMLAFGSTNQRVGPHIRAFRMPNGFRTGKAVPRIVCNRCRHYPGSCERSQEWACFAAQDAVVGVQDIRRTAGAKHEVVRSRVAVIFQGGDTCVGGRRCSGLLLRR